MKKTYIAPKAETTNIHLEGMIAGSSNERRIDPEEIIETDNSSLW